MEPLEYNRKGFLENSTHRECSRCGVIFKKRVPQFSSHRGWCKPCRADSEFSRSAEKRMLARSKGRARQLDIKFNLVLEDIEIPDNCPILNIPLIRARGTITPNSPTLDRLDNSGGYTKDNVWVISNLANSMKNSASKLQLWKFADWVNLQFPRNKTTPCKES